MYQSLVYFFLFEQIFVNFTALLEISSIFSALAPPPSGFSSCYLLSYLTKIKASIIQHLFEHFLRFSVISIYVLLSTVR